jgi:acyl-homoserine-lactone acylase
MGYAGHLQRRNEGYGKGAWKKNRPAALRSVSIQSLAKMIAACKTGCQAAGGVVMVRQTTSGRVKLSDTVLDRATLAPISSPEGIRVAFSKRSFISLSVAVLIGCGSAFAASPQKGTEILWDKFGVAHVFAKTTEDLFYGYGWAQAQSHGNLLLHLYGESRGRAAEYFGPSGLPGDKWVWTNSVPQRSAEWLAEQTPEFRKYMEAFAKGINDYAAKNPGALSEEAKRVLPVTALDPIEHTHRIVHFTYMAPLRLGAPAAAPADPTATLIADPAHLLDTPESVGSNAWAIAPSHTADGKAMLLGNPHLSWGGWQTYYEIHLTAPGIDLYGASQVGFPVLRFVFSQYLGFNQTVNSPDLADLYRVKTQGDGYLLDGKVLQFEKDSHEIKILQADGTFKTETLEIRRTVHGPIVKQEHGDPIALRVAGLDRPFMLEEYWQMETAHNFEAYQKAVSRLQVPTFNIIYADRDGHIEYLWNAAMPRRGKGDRAYWAGIVPGDTSETLWHDYLTYDELPKVIDPPNGFVHNTNDPPWNAAWPNTLDRAKYPPYLAPVNISFRAESSLRMLTEHDKLTYDQFLELKHSTKAELADRILPDLLDAAAKYGTPLAKQAADVLSKWDRHVEAYSKGAVLFYNWAKQFMGDNLGSQAGFAVAYDLKDPLTTPRGLKNPEKAAAQLDAAATQTIRESGALDVEWGKVMRWQLGDVDLPANGGFGNLGIFRVITFGPLHNGTRSQIHGETWVSTVEFTNPPKARVLMSYGNSSQPGTTHQTDQLPFMTRKELRTPWRTRAEIEANLESRVRF